MVTMRRAGWAVFVAAVAMGYGCGGASPEPVVNTDPNGKTYTEKYTCSQAFTGQPEFCADLNVVDTLIFHSTGTNTYEIRDVPDTGFVYTGTFVGDDFLWTAVSPDGYQESGTWTFNSRRNSFTGTSHYTADDGSYAGDCTENGTLGSGIPADPPVLGACP